MAKSTVRKPSAEEIRQQPEYQFIIAGIPVPDGLALHSSTGTNREPAEPDGLCIRAKVTQGCLGKGLLKLRQRQHSSPLVASRSSIEQGVQRKDSSEERLTGVAQYEDDKTQLVFSNLTKTRRVSFQREEVNIPHTDNKSKRPEPGTVSIISVEKKGMSAVCAPTSDPISLYRHGKMMTNKRTCKSANKEISFRDSCLVQINGGFLQTDAETAERQVDKYPPLLMRSDKRNNIDLNSDEFTKHRNKSTYVLKTVPPQNEYTISQMSSQRSSPSSINPLSESEGKTSSTKNKKSKDDCLLEQIVQENLNIMSNARQNSVSIPSGENHIECNESEVQRRVSRSGQEVSLQTKYDTTSSNSAIELENKCDNMFPTAEAVDSSLAPASKSYEDTPKNKGNAELKDATVSQTSLDSDKQSEHSSKYAHQQLERSKSCFDAKLEKSSVYLHSRSRTFTRASQYMRGTKRGLSQLNVHYSQTNTAHNDRIIFADLLKSAHIRNGIIGHSIFTMERRLYNRRRDPSVATTFYDRFASTKSTKTSAGPRSKSASDASGKKPSRTVADKERERKKRISRKNEQIELGYIPRASTLTSPGPEFIEHMLETCRYLRVSPEKQTSLFGTSSSIRSDPESQ